MGNHWRRLSYDRDLTDLPNGIMAAEKQRDFCFYLKQFNFSLVDPAWEGF